MPGRDHRQHHGSKLGPRIAGLVGKAMADHTAKTAHHRARVGTKAAVDFFRTITSETRHTIGPHAAQLAADPEMPDELRPFFHFIAHGWGEWQALSSFAVYGTGVGNGIGQLFANLLAPLIQKGNRAHPNTLLSPAAAADAAVRGHLPYSQAEHEAAGSAINAQRFQLMYQAAIQYPAAAELSMMVNRGELTADDAANLLGKQGLDLGLAKQLLDLRHQLLEPVALADMVVRGIIAETDAGNIANRQGVTDPDFHRMVLQAGEPPGIQDLLFAYRRGIISKARLEHGIRQSRVRNEWVDVVEALRHVPMATADAIRAAVQNHLSEAQARKIADENGLDPQHFTPLLESAGEPPGHQQMGELYHRGKVGVKVFEQAIRESRIKNKYVGDLVELSRRMIPERTLVGMIREGILDHGQAVGYLMELGFDKTDATRLVKHGSSQKTATDKQLAKGEVLALHETHAIGDAKATGLLKALGYHQSEVTWLLELSTLRRVAAEQRAAVNRVQSAFLARHVEHAEASRLLDQLGVPATERDRHLKLWAIEQTSQHKQLTAAQLVKAVKAGLLTAQVGGQRLVDMGYDADDAMLLLEEGAHLNLTPAPPHA